jgi:hypothetical protein
MLLIFIKVTIRIIIAISIITYGGLTDNTMCWTLTLVITNNYDGVAKLQTPQITESTAHVKSF